MRVVLVNPPDISVAKRKSSWIGKTVKGRFSSMEPPLGLAYIASSLERAQHEVHIIDCVGSELNWDQICDTLKKSDPDLIGITTLAATLQSAFEVATKSKEFHPEVPVVLGGHGTFKIEERILTRTKSVDIIVRGEGEDSVVELADALEKGHSIRETPGICFRLKTDEVVINQSRPFIQNLDLLPFPARHLLPMKSYVRDQLPDVFGKESFKGTPLISSRGCPFSCVFCASTRFYGQKWRPRSAENVVEEVNHLYQNYGKIGLSGFNFADDNFLAKPDRVIKICDLLIEKGLSHLKWICEARVDSAEEMLYSKMYNAGCRALAFGIESGNEKVLKASRKGVTKDMVRNAVKIAKSVGFKIWGYFLFGLPGDTDETMKETIEFAKELDLDINAFHPVFMYPGTELGDEQSIDWLSFIIEEELDAGAGHQNNISLFHPCVPTYADRGKMYTIMNHVRREGIEGVKKKGVLNHLIRKLSDIRDMIIYH